MKLPILFLCVMSVVAPAFADEAKITERKTCEQIRAEIAALSAIENPDAEQQQELKQLVLQQRTSCSAKANGRRTVSRQMPLAQGATENSATTPKGDVLDEYIATKKANCEKLNTEIEKQKQDSTKTYLVVEMQKYYDADCVEHSTGSVAETVVEVAASMPTKTEEEWAAEFDANLAAGLCGDGTKPNRFGCCTEEVFKDLGDEGFACCPKNGDYLCFPPLK